MGWFQEQIEKRKKLDEKKFEDSFSSLAGIKQGDQAGLSEQELAEKEAIRCILSYFHHQMVEIPSSIDDFFDKITYAMRPFEISCRASTLDSSMLEEGSSPLLVFLKGKKIPLVLLPRRDHGYTYFNFKTGKKGKVDETMLSKLEHDCYRFDQKLPSEKVSVREYMKYIQKSIHAFDIVLLILFSAIVAGAGLLLPYLTKVLTGQVVQSRDINQFVAISVYVISAATGLLLLKSTQAFLNSRISIKLEKSIREKTMMRLLSLPTSFFKQYNTGELAARFNSVPTLAGQIVNGVFVTLISAVMSIAYLFQLGFFVPSLVLPVILILLISNSFTVFTAFLQRKHTKKVLELSSKDAGITYEMINGIQKIRLSGSEKRVFAKWASAYSKSAKTRYRPPFLLRVSPAISLSITLLGNVLLYAIAAKEGVEVADYMAFVSAFGTLSAAFASLGQMSGVIATIQPLFEMARPILTAKEEESEGKISLASIQGNIKMEKVSFSYQEGTPILTDLDLDIKEGEYVAIVGKTGCGKSTFVRLLLGFEKPTSGKISYDGVDMEQLDLTSLRRNIGTVMQNGSLFHADILSNIIISAPSLGEEEAWEAAKVADIASDIEKMPMKMKTVISEGQGGISGGQKQRIMIARAIVHKPKILIFDEATSALDNKTQKSISESIDKLNCTRIVIAHRLSTIKNADRILMLEGGKIAESGDYETLISHHGAFAELVERQRIDNE